MSLDALRGFDMFWIIGADALVHGLRDVSDNEVVQGICPAVGALRLGRFRFEDLIFPMFVFIVGVSLVFSLSRTIEEHGPPGGDRADHAACRAAVSVGRFLLRRVQQSFEQIRLLGVLQRLPSVIWVPA